MPWNLIVQFVVLLSTLLWAHSTATLAQTPPADADANLAAEQAGQAQPQPTEPTLSPQAQVAARRGIEFLESKDSKKAIEMFKVAAGLHPQRTDLHHFLGLAYVQDKQLGLAWLHFRQAVRLNPGYARAVRDFVAMWQAFEARRVFVCGRTREQLNQLVGKPDKITQNGANEVWEYGFMQVHFSSGRLAATIDPRGLNDAIANSTHRLQVEFDDQARWRLGYRTVSRIHALSEYIPEGQSMAQWSELYTVQRIHGIAQKQTAQALMQQMEQKLKERNPNVEFAVIAEAENDVLFQWRDAGGKDRQPQHEIVRMLAGSRDLHRLAYSQRVAQIPTESAQRWVGILRNASLVASSSTPPMENDVQP